MTTRYIGEGETKPVVATLYDGEGATRMVTDLTGLTLGILVTDRAGANVPVTGKATVLTANAGSVQFQPSSTDFQAAGSPYRVTWTVTDGNNTIAWYPNKEPETWKVRKP
jgi:hypothetical protein